jgi:hypothetical protein
MTARSEAQRLGVRPTMAARRSEKRPEEAYKWVSKH